MITVRAQQVSKAFEGNQALERIDLEVQAGEIVGLIGPDGAGKTTLLRCICTLLTQDEGRIEVLGMDTRHQRAGIRARIGYMPQQFSLYPDLTVQQNLDFFAELFEVPPAERAERLEKLYRFSRLGPFRDYPAQALSGGMKQKLALSCALIHTPPLLVLDEPTFGVDPLSRQEFWEILQEVNRQGTTILVSTGYMDEADLCHRVGLMNAGRMVAFGQPDQLRSLYRYPLFLVEGERLRQLRDFFRAQPEVHSTRLFGDSLHVSFNRPPQPEQWQRWLRTWQGPPFRWEVIDPAIEDVFLELAEGA